MNPALHRLAERIRRNEPIPAPLAVLLSAATPISRAGMWWRHRRPTVKAGAYVISIGNLTAGGAGKTPLVIERARHELAQGRKVAVLTRGYGSTPSRDPVAAVADSSAGLFAALGDEAALIARKLPGVVIVKCPDRVAAARVAVEQYACDILIMDDGFQHVRLYRDEDIVVIDARNPFGNGSLIPRGILREPIDALRRAHQAVLTRADQAANPRAIVEQIRTIYRDIPIRITRHAPTGCWRVNDGTPDTLGRLREKPVRAVCAIGSPEAFFDTLASVGISIAERHAFPDHAEIPESILTGPLPVVVTEKDAVRMHRAPAQVFALSIEVEDWPLS